MENIDNDNKTMDNDNIGEIVPEIFEPKLLEPNEIEEKRGRPAHLPNEHTRNRIYELSKVGTTQQDMAKVLSISVDTLVKYYSEEMALGIIEANAEIAGTLFKKAKTGDTQSMIFWLKSRAKWKETTQHEVGGSPDGQPVEIKIITGIE